MNRTNSKGESGEDWIDEAVKIFGYKVIKFDWWQAAADRLYYKDGKAILAQVKYKEPRIHYPDTGLEVRKFGKFREMCRESGIQGMILFTDKSGDVYGELLENLKEEKHGGEYNKNNNEEMIYFWIEDLKTIKELL